MYNDYETFKKEVFNLTTIDLDKYKERQMKRRIDALIAKNHVSTYYDYVDLLKKNKNMFNEFVNYLTINVSEFFRNSDQWMILNKEILPYLINLRSKRLNIWSAACSTGEEPYSMAMLLSDHVPIEYINILATDLDKKVLEKAISGVYSGKEIKGIEQKYLNKFFMKIDDDVYKVNDRLKSCIKFKQHDLLSDEYPRGMDLIVCRNVLIYFTEEAKEMIYSNFHKALNDNCMLFVGSTEQIIQSSKIGYESVKSFFYKKV